MYVSGLTNPNANHTIIPVAPAIPAIDPIGLTNVGCFIDKYAITIEGNAIANNIPAKITVWSDVFIVNPNIPNPKIIETITKVVAFALLLVETPPSRIPTARKINPKNIVRPVNACMPSMNV